METFIFILIIIFLISFNSDSKSIKKKNNYNLKKNNEVSRGKYQKDTAVKKQIEKREEISEEEIDSDIQKQWRVLEEYSRLLDEDDVSSTDEQERQRREQEETRRRAEQERQRREQEEARRRAEQERQRREQEEARRRAEQERQRSEQEEARRRAEQSYNINLATRIKCPRYLYHFTDRSNLDSIRQLGGLYSWGYMERNGFDIPRPGGNQLSRSLDIRYQDWSDYVRLSFCQYHPMINRLKRDGYDIVILKIDSSIISETSYISDRNATSNGANIIRAIDLEDINNFLDFEAINNTGYIEYGTREYTLHQAEVLIKTKVPYEYIINFSIVGDNMAKRPAYISDEKNILPNEEYFDFTFHTGFHISQKQRSIDELHNAILKKYQDVKILEISSKSRQDLGIKLSAFNLMYPIGDKLYPVENVFQSSKVLNSGGPYTDLLYKSPRDAKRDPKIKVDPKQGLILKCFKFENIVWDLEPKTAFYDWIYIKALSYNIQLAEKLLNYNCFTDIEFNPKKSINCQARAASLFVSLSKHNILDKVLDSREFYLSVISPKIKKLSLL